MKRIFCPLLGTSTAWSAWSKSSMRCSKGTGAFRSSRRRMPGRSALTAERALTAAGRATRPLAMFGMAVVIAHLACLGCVHAQRQADDELASRITTALLASDELNLSRIEVNVDDGIVYLSGMSDDHESKSHAEQEAQGIAGVKGIINKIEVDF